MRQRPWALVVLSVLHFAAPVGNIALNALVMKRDVLGYFAVAMSSEYLMKNWFIFVCPLIAGYAIYACKKWSFFVYLFAITILFSFSYTAYMSKASYIGIIPVLMIYFINIAVVGYFLLPAVREVYFNPRLRWWESLPRYRCDFEVLWNNEGESQATEGKVGNFSMNGLFLKSSKFPEDGAGILVQLKLENGQLIPFTGQAIHHGQQDAVGFGVKFSHSKESQAEAKKIVDVLDGKGYKLRRLTYEDSFSYWIKNLLTTGRGIIPRKDK